MLKNLIAYFDFSSRTSGRHFFDRVRERFRLGNLRPDVHLHADDIDVAHSGGALVNGLDAIERDAELVFARTGGDVLVRVRIDIGIHAQRNWRAQISFARRCDQCTRSSASLSTLKL